MAQLLLIQKQQFQGGGGDPISSKYSTYYWGRSNSVDTSERATGGELSYLRGEEGWNKCK